MGWEDTCPLPQCWPGPLDAAEIGAAVLELTILRALALCPSDKQSRWCYFLHWGKSCANKWKWILRSASWQNDVCQPCLYWNLMTEDSVVAEKDGLCLWSFTVLWTVPCFALFTFPWKLLPLPSFHFLRNTQNQRTWSGHPVYSPAPTWESIGTSVWLLHFSNWHWLIDPKITGELSGLDKLERQTDEGSDRLLS